MFSSAHNLVSQPDGGIEPEDFRKRTLSMHSMRSARNALKKSLSEARSHKVCLSMSMPVNVYACLCLSISMPVYVYACLCLSVSMPACVYDTLQVLLYIYVGPICCPVCIHLIKRTLPLTPSLTSIFLIDCNSF